MAETTKEAPPSVKVTGLYVLCGLLAAYTYYAMKEAEVYVLPALILIAGLALILPPSRKLLKIDLGLKLSAALAFAFLVAIALTAGSQKASRQEAAQLKMQQDSAARIAKLKADREAEYASNKAKIIAEVEQQLASNQPREALATISKFMTVTKDPDLGRLQPRAELQVMKLDLLKEDSLTWERRAQIYRYLIQEEPGSIALYKDKLADVESKLAAKQKAEQDQARQAQLKELVKKQFSGFDGSHRGTEAAIKARLKDPGSYEHVETRYVAHPDSLTVYTTYRARNSFNAIITGTAVATVDAQGNVLSIDMNR
jgi:hypothetical protein